VFDSIYFKRTYLHITITDMDDLKNVHHDRKVNCVFVQNTHTHTHIWGANLLPPKYIKE